MGTRHLVGVVRNGTPVVAQYGQWDGYPSHTGRKVLEFCSALRYPPFRKEFEAALDKCKFITQAERLERFQSVLPNLDKSSTFVTYEEGELLSAAFPELNRNIGVGVLELIRQSDGLELNNSWDFGEDSLFCEYAYVIDLDNDTLEFYTGFQTHRPDAGRWADGRPSTEQGYHPIALQAVFSLDELPTVEGLEAIEG